VKDEESLKKTHLTKEKCKKWLLQISDINDPADYHLPYGFKWIKVDESERKAKIEEFINYCTCSHNLRPFWESLQTGGYIRSTAELELSAISFLPNPYKAKEELQKIAKNYKDKTKLELILEREIPLDIKNEEEGSHFDNFLKAYAQISPTITLFWYLVFQTLCFHLSES